MTTHYDDEAQVEDLKRWWKENWKALAAGLVIGLGAIVGFEQYRHYKDGRSAQASQVYEDLKKALTDGKMDEATTMADRLAKEFDGTPYAANAALRLASTYVEQNKLDEAATRLKWVAEHAHDDGLQQIARLRQARVLWQQGKTDDALKLIDAMPAEYAALTDELRGDIKLSQGDRKAARAAYERAMQAASEGPVNHDGLQRKIDDLADVGQS
ncbi:MAG TPA: tetratricopeptide repeat protein [Solimonas sp.]|nr:tetratricopeptide repeat protein [Solimonas sp.]